MILQFDSQVKSEEGASKLEYKPGILDDFFMHSFRNKLVEVSLQNANGVLCLVSL